MSQRDDSTGPDEEMRPLPDGGLSSSMPDWLRRPPAWRDLPHKNDPPDEGSLPEPDTSVIDPRKLVTVDDLPQWLRDIAAREPEPVPGSEVAEEPVASEPEPDAPSQPAPVPHTTGPQIVVPWIWAMRAAIILIILSIIFYVFVL